MRALLAVPVVALLLAAPAAALSPVAIGGCDPFFGGALCYDLEPGDARTCAGFGVGTCVHARQHADGSVAADLVVVEALATYTVAQVFVTQAMGPDGGVVLTIVECAAGICFPQRLEAGPAGGEAFVGNRCAIVTCTPYASAEATADSLAARLIPLCVFPLVTGGGCVEVRVAEDGATATSPCFGRLAVPGVTYVDACGPMASVGPGAAVRPVCLTLWRPSGGQLVHQCQTLGL